MVSEGAIQLVLVVLGMGWAVVALWRSDWDDVDGAAA